MVTVKVNKLEQIFAQGDKSDSMYFVKSGLVLIEGTSGGEKSEIAKVGKGQFFGEMGLIEKAPRSADALAIEKTELVKITEEDFTEFVRNNAEDVMTILRSLSARLRTTTGDLHDLVGVIENKDTGDGILAGIVTLFKKVFGDEEHLEPMPKEAYAAGEILFSQGDIGTRMFVIHEGEAEIWFRYGKPDAQLLATVGKGAILGETAVIEKERRTATVIAKTDLRVEAIVNAKLTSFLRANPDEALKIMKSLSAKLRATTKEYLKALETVNRYLAEKHIDSPALTPYIDYYNAMMGISNGSVFNTKLDNLGCYDYYPFFHFED